MNYEGLIADIPVGSLGLKTDDPHSKLQPGQLTRAINISLQDGKVQKDFGSMRWNSAALPGGIRAGVDYAPDEATNLIVVMCSDGNVYKFTDFFTSLVVGASGGAPATLNVSAYANIIEGGAEETGNPKKLFFMTGVDPVQVMTGDGATRTTISAGAADWTGTNQPVAGIIHRGRLFAWLKRGSTVYASDATNQEDFTTSPLLYNVPGSSNELTCAFIHNKRLYIAKYPNGLYQLVDDDPDPSNWFWVEVNGSFGAQNADGYCTVFDDMLIANQFGGLSTLTSIQQFGDVKTSDMFNALGVQNFVKEEILAEGRGIRHGVYYADKKTAIFTYRSQTGIMNDRLCYVDFQTPQLPKVVWVDKDQPSCLFLVRDIQGVRRPWYGAEDGYLYQLDQPNRWVGTSDQIVQEGYRGEFWTPFFDFGGDKAEIAESMKQFDHLELQYEAAGDWNLTVECWVDGLFVKKLQYNMGFKRSNLDEMQADTTAIVDSECPLTMKQKLGFGGRRIQFRAYNEEAGQNFRIIAMRVYLQITGAVQERTK